jgi:hypothetical protein
VGHCVALEQTSAIDWTAPWLAPVAERGAAVAAHWVTHGGPLYESLNAVLDAPVTFVAQDALGPRTPYESHVAHLGQVPTRDHLHDFFNGLAWSHWPGLKARFNTLHAQAIAQAGERRERGPVRDGLTLFDENGAVLVAPPEIWSALRAHDWVQALVNRRALWSRARLWLVGHALMQQLTAPRKGLTAHVWLLDEATNARAWHALGACDHPVQCQVDAAIATQLDAATIATKPFTPLPVLGVPGWWSDNADPDFYADAAVFRPRRARS